MQTISKYSLAACSHFVFTAFPYENLGERGFAIDGKLDQEADGVITQTLLINTPLQESVRLEFKEIVDEEEFLRSLKKDSAMVRGREVLRPNLRFYGEEALQTSVGSIPVKIEAKQKMLASAKPNTNSVQHLWGLYLGLNEKGIQEWSQFLGSPPRDGGWVLADGVRIQIAEPEDGIYDFMEARKDFPFWAVILKCDSLSEFEKVAEPERILQWHTSQSHQQPVALIKEHLTDWDILVF